MKHLLSLPLSTSLPHTSLTKAKSLQFPEKQTSHKRGKKKKKKSSSFFVFFLQMAAVSHIASPIHTLTLSEPLPYPNLPQKYHMGRPHTPLPSAPPLLSFPPPSSHTPPCPPGCVSSGLCGINELIHTVLSRSIPPLPLPQCKQAYSRGVLGSEPPPNC